MLKICHLTPFFQQSIEFANKLSERGEAEQIDLSQTVMSLENCSQEMLNFRSQSISYYQIKSSNQVTNPLDSYCNQLWECLLDYDLIHIYRLFSNFGMNAVLIAKSLNKPVIGFDYWYCYHSLMARTGIQLIDGFHASDDLSASIISSIYSGPITVIKEDNANGKNLLTFYQKTLTDFLSRNDLENSHCQ